MNLKQLHVVQAYADQLPFKNSSFNGVTCSHAFYELKGKERMIAIDEVARVLRMSGRFCLIEHTKPQRRIPRLLFYVRIFFLGAKDARKFLGEEETILGGRFKKVAGQMSPTRQSKLIYAEKRE